jgi:phosphoglycerol geranylgeranyltransferase
MSLGAHLRRVAWAANTAVVAGRTLLGLDTNPVPAAWTHISKVDPEGEKQLPVAFPLYLAETSAVSVGGSRDVTAENTEETMELAAATDAPTLHEPSGAGHVTEQTRGYAELLAIPEVLNGETEALVGTLGKGLDYVRGELGPGFVEDRLGIPLDGDGLLGERLGNFAAAYLMQEAMFEAYIIMNPDSAAAREAGVTESDLLSPTAARERALAAEYHLESEVVYLEYSGTFGGEEAATILDELDDALTAPRLWYGGGLDSAEKAETVLAAGADAVVVGDVLHDVAGAEANLVDRAREAFDSAGESSETVDDAGESSEAGAEEHDETVDDAGESSETVDGVPDYGKLADWVEEAVDVGETSATRYLSTVPEVDDAADLATEYLAAGVELALVVDAIADQLDDPDAERIAETLRADSRLAETRLAGLLDEEQADLPRRIAATLLADRFDVAIADGFAARHLGVEVHC